MMKQHSCIWAFFAVVLGSTTWHHHSVVNAFTPSTTTCRLRSPTKTRFSVVASPPRIDSSSLHESGSGNNDKNDNGNEEKEMGARLVNRFFNPQIDDPALPLTEAGLVQIVAPTLQLFWLVSLDSPYPSWAAPLYDVTFAPRGAFLAPTLIHGAGLACCWLMGCLAARAFELPSFRAKDGNYGPVIASTLKAGSFACGTLILSTQVDLYQEFGGYVQLGDSQEGDIRIYRALVEVLNDIFFEFIVLLPWRLFRSNFD